MGQVPHALLTRPPLTLDSLGFLNRPFDLHVLGTPPAFILSQDQTLISFFPGFGLNWLSFLQSIFFRLTVSWFVLRSAFL